MTIFTEDRSSASIPTYGNCSDDTSRGCMDGRMMDPQYRDFYLNARFVTGLIFYPSICVFGLISNALGIRVMCQKQMQSSTNVYLLSLAISDSIKLLIDFLYFVVILLLELSPETGQQAYGYLYPYAHYIFNSSVCISAWLTVSVALERYIYVCHPTRVKQYCSIQRARTISFCVFIIMSLLAVPYALRYRTDVCRVNGTSGAILKYDLNVTELWQDETFKTSYTWVQNCLRSIIPLIVLIILNTCIMYGIRRCRFGRNRSARRHRITFMLIAVIIVFLVCVTPDAIMSTFFGFGYYEENYLARGIREITDLLILVNSATNFVIYCIFNTIFWKNFISLFCGYCSTEPIRLDIEDTNMRRLSLIARTTPHKQTNGVMVTEL